MLASESSQGLDNHILPTTTDQPQGVGLENTLCPGCKLSAVSENGGLVVAFGQSFFHVDCFKCAKCGDKVTADTNLLLLSDGSPICANCSYSCNVCHMPILDEAIMTGDDAYHAHCFKCKVCKSRIDELVFAKTSQGIYCMNCHNERMIKVRKHAQKKAERDRERATNGGSSSGRSRDRSQNGEQSSHTLKSIPSHSSIQSHNPSGTPSINRRPSVSRLSPSQPSFPGSPQPPIPLPLPEGKPRYDASAPIDPEKTPVAPRVRTPQNGTIPLDGVLPPNGITPPPVEGLKITPNKRSKRHSINPGLVLASTSVDNLKKPTSPPTLSPNSAVSTFGTAQQQSPTPPMSNGGRESPRVPSPLREQFPSHGMSPNLPRPSSRTSHREASFPLTPPPYESHQFDHDVPRNRTISASASMPPNEGVSRPPLRPTVTVDSVPRTTPESANGNVSPDITVNGSVIRHQYSFDERRRSGPRGKHRLSNTPSLSILDERGRSRSASPRPDSPMHRIDVPQGIESGTDTEDSKQSSDEGHGVVSPPPLPPKDLRSPPLSSTALSPLSPDGDQADSCEDIELESNPVEHVSHSTFIAPALPPIRFSMSGADFTELLSNVGGLPPLKNLDQMALQQVAEEVGQTPANPPPTASNAENEKGDSPRSDVTIFFGEGEVASPRANGRMSLDSAPELPYKGPPPLTKRSKTTESPYARTTDLESSFSHDSHSTSATPSSKSAVTLVRSKSEARGSPTAHRRLPSNASARSQSDSTQTHVTLIENSVSGATMGKRPDTSDLVLRRLREAITDANERGSQQLKLDRGFIEAIIQQMEQKSTQFLELKGNFDGIKRASKQYQDGLTVAQAEYDRELKARRDAEAEVTRLRVLLSGQAVRLTALSGDTRKQQLKEQLTKDLNESLSGLEQDLSKLKVARDVTLAEVEELSASKNTPGEAPPSGLSRSLTTRLEKIRGQYEQDLVPLKQQRESLVREIAELKSARDIILEETTVLSARNEELAQLTSQYARRIESLPENATYKPRQSSFDKYRPAAQPSHQATGSVPAALNMNPSFNSSTTSITPLSDESIEPSKPLKVIKLEAEVVSSSKSKFKWMGTRTKEALSSVAETPNKPGRTLEHSFQQTSVLRFTKCDHCGETLWGSQLRCSACHISIHSRCLQHVNGSCHPPKEEVSHDLPPPSMFGRDLVEQVKADSTTTGIESSVPVIVEKCIDAVEASALDYEGIYRKTGGTGQSKAITSLFERGNYNAFDLRDTDRFNDICSVTSVLKTYFRSLPVPLFTYDLHDGFMSAVHVRDTAARDQQLRELVNQLPTEHYYTLKVLMLHLNRICERSERNLMNARNLGVVFGPTLMRSRDPSAEFGDMAGKALSVEWLVENAPSVFTR